MQSQNLPRTSFKECLHLYLTAEEQDLSRQLWCQLMTGSLKAANRALDGAAPRVRDAVKTAIRMRNEDGRDHENPFL
jgi:hypothetical protein